MTTQSLTSTPATSNAVRALGGLVGAHSTLTRELSAQLVDKHGLTLSEYEVLLLLSRAPEHSMRRIDLAGEVRLSPSGVTRMLNRLEDTGLVTKGKCSTDARVIVPLARPGIVTGMVLSFAHTVGEFGVVLMVGGNLPGSTRTVSISIYDDVQALDYVRAGRTAALLLAFSFVVLAVTYRLHRRSGRAWPIGS